MRSTDENINNHVSIGFLVFHFMYNLLLMTTSYLLFIFLGNVIFGCDHRFHIGILLYIFSLSSSLAVSSKLLKSCKNQSSVLNKSVFSSNSSIMSDDGCV